METLTASLVIVITVVPSTILSVLLILGIIKITKWYIKSFKNSIKTIKGVS